VEISCLYSELVCVCAEREWAPTGVHKGECVEDGPVHALRQVGTDVARWKTWVRAAVGTDGARLATTGFSGETSAQVQSALLSGGKGLDIEGL
jgi:hypothetical protein